MKYDENMMLTTKAVELSLSTELSLLDCIRHNTQAYNEVLLMSNTSVNVKCYRNDNVEIFFFR